VKTNTPCDNHMKIAYLSGYLIPSRRASSVHVMNMCQSLARNGHDVTLFGFVESGQEQLDPFEYYGVSQTFALQRRSSRRRRGEALLAIPWLYQQLRRHDRRDTLVYSRSLYWAVLAACMRFRVIYESHWVPPTRSFLWLERRLFASRSFEKMVVISDALKAAYRSICDPSLAIDVCHDAANPPAGDAVARDAWPSERDALQVGYTGSLGRGRGIELILECAESLPQCDFHLAGEPDQKSQVWKPEDRPNVHLHGFLQPSQVQGFLARCNVLLMPYQGGLVLSRRGVDSTSWMSPMKMFEYMAARKAIIASDLPVLREVLTERNAVLVDAHDVNAWVEAIRRCDDSSYRDSLAGNAHATFLEHHTWDKRARNVIEGVVL
jgi:glycosyltransferase involved in cell wall biosynthesis